MSPRAAHRLAWSLWAFSVAVVAACAVLTALNWDTAWPDRGGSLQFLIPIGGLTICIATVGALVASRRPGHPIGWVLAVGAAPLMLNFLGDEYAIYAVYTDPGSLPRPDLVYAVGVPGIVPAMLAMPALLLLLFPDGRLPGRRWRPALWLAAGGAAALLLGNLFRPGRPEPQDFPQLVNPLGIGSSRALFDALFVLGLIATAASILLAAAAMIVRLRRSRGLERQQLKWIASAAAAFPLVCAVGLVLRAVAADDVGALLIIALGFPLIPVAAGYAILRHRLFDVDLVINRALVYGSLTAVLAGAYVGLVLLLGLALSPLTSQSDLAIAVSTLAVAALFQPVRRRLQRAVDRRFYRRRYDAARTLERFSSRLQAQTDLEALRADLAGVVREAMQPAHVSVWLRQGGR